MLFCMPSQVEAVSVSNSMKPSVTKNWQKDPVITRQEGRGELIAEDVFTN